MTKLPEIPIFPNTDKDNSGINSCPLCGRPLGKSLQKHHLIPKSQGGMETVTLHAICHRKVHALFNGKQLAREFFTIETLLANDDMRTFVKWTNGKPSHLNRRYRRKSQERGQPSRLNGQKND